MADNIKIVGSILNTTEVSRYDNADLRLITSKKIQKSFNANKDYIEYHVYDIGNNLLDANYDYRQYRLPSNYSLNPGVTSNLNINNTTATGAEVGSVSNLSTTSSTYPIIEIDPVQDLQDLGYTSGEFKVQYNIFKNKISKFPNADLFIKEISPDRTEIRVGSVVLTDSQLESGSLELINSYSSSSIFDPFLLDFSNNRQEIITNIVLNPIDTGYEILFKLYNELDPTISEKDSLWVVEEISSPYIFNLNLDAIFSVPEGGNKLRGPKFKNRGRFNRSNTTSNDYKSLDELALNQDALQNLSVSQSINININFDGIGGEGGGFNSFVTFGSALSRVQNFYTKVQKIETYNKTISQYTPNISTTSSLQSEINSYTSSINNIIANFDGFENYLYFSSGSLTSSFQYGVTPFPKSGSNKPYSLYPTTSSQSKTWYSSITSSAEDYDLNNVNYFKYSVPGFIVDDPNNENYLVFLNMMGQFFDNIWIYIKSITSVNVSNNNLNLGISKDVVYNLLQSLGISVFNSFGNQDIANYLVGSNTGSASYNGYLTNFSATSSYLNNIPKKDILAESYKRIYHNLPILLQRKGTVAGLRTLLSTFGIPNQDYYNIISNLSGSYVGGKLITSSLFVTNSYYTPTGSVISSSILNIKEYGGSTTAELLKGYNNNKVRIVNTTITGSVLSPLVSIQQYTSESSDFRTTDDHYVDVSFSPQTLIDTFASSSIISSNPSWSLDDYIGDPRQLYSGSYSDLNAQRSFYLSPLSSSIIPFTSTVGTGSMAATDYNNFIRLVQFFDNSLFKMLEDYVPGRASLSTGVTINSPVLERNKIAYANPNTTTVIAVGSNNISGSRITASYDPFYNQLQEDRVAYFDGAISGSQINIYDDYFTPGNFNPYARFIDLYNVNHSIYQQINESTFTRSKFNTLLNNVSGSLFASKRKNIEYLNNYYLQSTSSFLINSASLGPTFAPTGTLNINGVTFAITGSTLPTNTAKIIYVTSGSNALASMNNLTASFNASKSLAPYSSSIGNMYVTVSGSTGLYVYSNKLVSGSIGNTYYIVTKNNVTYSLASGSDFNYVTSSAQLQDSYLTLFSYNAPRYDGVKVSSVTYNTYTTASAVSGGYEGDVSYGKSAAIDQYVRKFGLFTQIVSSSFFPGRNATALKYLVDESGSLTELNQNLSNTPPSTHWFEIQNTFKQGKNSTIALFDNQQYSNQKTTDGVKPVFDSGYSYYPTLYFTSGSDQKLYFQYTGKGGSGVLMNINNTNNAIFYQSTATSSYAFTTGSGAVGSIGSIYSIFDTQDADFAQGNSNYFNIRSNPTITFPTYSISQYGINMAFSANFGINVQFPSSSMSASYKFDIINQPSGSSTTSSLATQTLTATSTLGNLSSILTFDINTSYNPFNKGDQITFQLKQFNYPTSFTASILSTGTGTPYSGLKNSISLAGANTYAFTGSSSVGQIGQFISGSSGINQLIINQSLSGFTDYLYLPATSSVLYASSSYGNVYYTFSPKVGDVALIYYSPTQYQELNISNVSINSNDNNKLVLTVTPNLVSSLVNTTYTPNTISKALFLSKIPDETNINLSFNKTDGQTSYGFIIPDNLSPEVLNNIDTITRQVQQKLLSTSTPSSGIIINTV
jgi:hypothetical protein